MLDLAELDTPILYLGFEMKPEEMMERMFVNRKEVDNFDLLKGGFSKHKQEWEDFKASCRKMKLVFADGFGRRWNDLNDFLNRLTIKPRVIVLDFIQAIPESSTESKRFIDEYIRNFREMAVVQGFAGVIVSQINRTNPDAKNKQPQLHQLKGSGFLEEHADLVLLLDWSHKSANVSNKEEFVVNVAKNRNGRTGYVKLRYRPQFYRFDDWVEPGKESAIRVDWDG